MLQIFGFVIRGEMRFLNFSFNTLLQIIYNYNITSLSFKLNMTNDDDILVTMGTMEVLGRYLEIKNGIYIENN